ncbi:MAG: hypothetical protein NZM38_03575 [Cytophagales bacterium]|nr:hypothetical protein [Cytophagales bacterium]MDW8383832.1 hypothetical protein [Flammeovirgaceae bacterium]
MNKFKEEENQFLLRIFSEALQSASKAFSQLLHKPVKVDFLELRNEIPFQVLLDSENELYYNLTTSVKGELLAKSYLIFHHKDAEHLMKCCFSDKDYSQKELEEFLLEIDNILSASVVSKLADFLKKFIYGYVPQLQYERGNLLYQSIFDEQHSWEITLSLHSVFLIEEIYISPIFIWNFSSEFVQEIINNLHSK